MVVGSSVKGTGSGAVLVLYFSLREESVVRGSERSSVARDEDGCHCECEAVWLSLYTDYVVPPDSMGVCAYYRASVDGVTAISLDGRMEFEYGELL